MTADIATFQARIDRFLCESLATALSATEYQLPSFGRAVPLAGLERAVVACRHADGASDATYRVAAFGDELTMVVQLNVWRFVVVFSVPQTDELDMEMLRARLARWQIGAEHAGWQLGWRQSIDPEHESSSVTQIYCYALAPKDLLDDPREELYWRTDIVQMVRSLMLEARRVGVRLALRQS